MTLEQLKASAATLAGEAAKATGDLVQKGKKQVDLLALENKLAKAQRQLGALVYSLHKNGEENDALVARYVEAIAAVEQEIEAVESAETLKTDEAEDVKVTVCPGCGAEVAPGAMFCSGCGQKLQ